MTGDYTLTLPVMLAVAIATVVSHGPELRHHLHHQAAAPRHRHRPGPSADPFQELTAADAMRPFRPPLTAQPAPPVLPDEPGGDRAWRPGPVTHQRHPQVLFANESLTQALRQLVLYGRDGLPVLSTDGQQLEGWITSQNVLQAIARQIGTAQAAGVRAYPAAEWAFSNPPAAPDHAPTPLHGYQILEVTIRRPHTRGVNLAVRLHPGVGTGRPHPARRRPRTGPRPRRPHQLARPCSHPSGPAQPSDEADR